MREARRSGFFATIRSGTTSGDELDALIKTKEDAAGGSDESGVRFTGAGV